MARLRLVTLLAAVAAVGCGGGTVNQYDDQTLETARRMRTIHKAFMQFHQGQRVAPTAADLKTQLAKDKAAGDPAELLVSPRDRQPFVVVPIPPPGAPESREERAYVAYEKVGADGKRMVVDSRGTINLVGDDEFAKVKFAGGHKPAL